MLVPTDLQGGFIIHQETRAMQLHLSVQDEMTLKLGPKQYDNLIKVSTGSGCSHSICK